MAMSFMCVLLVAGWQIGQREAALRLSFRI